MNISMKVMVVDDDEAILEALRDTLEVEGYDVVTTTSGEETIKMADQHRPQVILLDMLLSGIDGRDVCRELKANNGTDDIPVIMFSAHPNVEASVMACGSDMFLAKPFDIDFLLNAIQRYE